MFNKELDWREAEEQSCCIEDMKEEGRGKHFAQGRPVTNM